ncbi:hypothetical protein ASC86_19495 [Rhizobium sp. Root1212]|nr:hypothetical protein ASC86_19495 [Rhizobium sp. Root1212]
MIRAVFMAHLQGIVSLEALLGMASCESKAALLQTNGKLFHHISRNVNHFMNGVNQNLRRFG